MFDKILIANRGEIACRVARTARRMGVRTVAVYSDADEGALHVASADEAVRIGPAPAAQSYLDGAAVIAAALRTGTQAIHPGYGFLSENEDFAQACEDAGLVFIGPPAAAIRAMGDKSAAKALMAPAGVPLVPGYHGEDQDPALLAREAARIGWPVLIKASAGGGGKGMRAVHAAGDFAAALAACQREAKNAFGDERVLLERLLEAPRHIEIQVFADTRGHCIHLHERDCSVQRRHQKVLEEAPAPGLSDAQRAAMGEAAVRAARAIGYVGAGTVEFIAGQDGAFHFMEMNTRLQVEHPVTEMITGLDLVEWQLRVAAGEALPLTQEAVPRTGHAIEARIYAEDPSRDFLPATGRIHYLAWPQASASVRIDTGVREGDTIPPWYDPMVAKLIVHGRDREDALARLAAALDDTRIAGLATNVAFLARLARNADFAGAVLDTGLIERHRDSLQPAPAAPTDTTLVLASIAVLSEPALRTPGAGSDPWSPWNATDGWRLNQDHAHPLQWEAADGKHELVAHYRASPAGTQAWEFERDGRRITVVAQVSREGKAVRITATLDGVQVQASVARDGDTLDVFHAGRHATLALLDPLARAMQVEDTAGGLLAPMPGKVVALLAEPGAPVERGTPLMILEAMKMEHTISAPAAGRVGRYHYAAGEQVAEGAELLAFEPLESGNTP